VEEEPEHSPSTEAAGSDVADPVHLDPIVTAADAVELLQEWGSAEDLESAQKIISDLRKKTQESHPHPNRINYYLRREGLPTVSVAQRDAIIRLTEGATNG